MDWVFAFSNYSIFNKQVINEIGLNNERLIHKKINYFHILFTNSGCFNFMCWLRDPSELNYSTEYPYFLPHFLSGHSKFLSISLAKLLNLFLRSSNEWLLASFY
jgi:hypothetical protein